MRASRRRRTAASRTADAARLASYPHPYPEGWYRLSDSAALRPGDIRYIECLGRQFVLWRGRGGAAHVFQAYCPHLGANLSHGRVRGDCIECPFHGWRFTGEGRAAYIPYSYQVPRGRLAESFPVQEAHGQLFMYHSCRGTKTAAAPPYAVPRIDEVDGGAFAFRGAHDAGRVRMHIIEFAENAVDTAHFKPVHGRMRIPWTQVPVPGVRIEHETDWFVDRDVSWKMYFLDNAVLRIFGRRVEAAGAHARIAFFGPGSVVKFRFTIPGRGDIEMYQTHLPIEPLEQQVNFRWFADRQLPRWLVRYVVGNWISQWARDIAIWETKIYQRHPRLCAGDGPVFRLRQWYRQFLPATDGVGDALATVADGSELSHT